MKALERRVHGLLRLRIVLGHDLDGEARPHEQSLGRHVVRDAVPGGAARLLRATRVETGERDEEQRARGSHR